MTETDEAARPPDHDGVVPPAPGEVVLHHGLTVIEASTEADLVAVMNDSRLAPLVVARIGARAALVLPGAAPQLLLEMKRSGRSATVIGGR